jgi:hypothetical protein
MSIRPVRWHFGGRRRGREISGLELFISKGAAPKIGAKGGKKEGFRGFTVGCKMFESSADLGSLC